MGNGKRMAVVAVSAALLAGVSACGSEDDDTSTAASGGSSTASASTEPVKIGQNMSVSGAVSVFADPYLKGQEAWIEKVNAEGGVNGRKIELTTLDDARDTAKAVANTRQLISDGNVAVTNGTGAGTVLAMAPVLDSAKVPYVFPIKSDIEMPTKEWVFVGYPPYADQILGLIDWAFAEKGAGSVYYLGGESGVPDREQEAAKQGTEDGGGTWLGGSIVPIGTPDIAPYAIAAGKQRADWLVAGIYSADLARVLTYMAEHDTLPRKGILAISSVPGDAFLAGIPEAAAKLFTSTNATVPTDDPAAKECNDALAESAPDTKADMVTLTGCQNAQWLVAMVEAAGDDITPEGMRNALLSMQDDASSPLAPPLTFTEDDHVGMKEMPLVQIEDGAWVSAGTIPVPAVWR